MRDKEDDKSRKKRKKKKKPKNKKRKKKGKKKRKKKKKPKNKKRKKKGKKKRKKKKKPKNKKRKKKGKKKPKKKNKPKKNKKGYINRNFRKFVLISIFGILFLAIVFYYPSIVPFVGENEEKLYNDVPENSNTLIYINQEKINNIEDPIYTIEEINENLNYIVAYRKSSDLPLTKIMYGNWKSSNINEKFTPKPDPIKYKNQEIYMKSDPDILIPGSHYSIVENKLIMGNEKKVKNVIDTIKRDSQKSGEFRKHAEKKIGDETLISLSLNNDIKKNFQKKELVQSNVSFLTTSLSQKNNQFQAEHHIKYETKEDLTGLKSRLGESEIDYNDVGFTPSYKDRTLLLKKTGKLDTVINALEKEINMIRRSIKIDNPSSSGNNKETKVEFSYSTREEELTVAITEAREFEEIIFRANDFDLTSGENSERLIRDLDVSEGGDFRQKVEEIKVIGLKNGEEKLIDKYEINRDKGDQGSNPYPSLIYTEGELQVDDTGELESLKIKNTKTSETLRVIDITKGSTFDLNDIENGTTISIKGEIGGQQVTLLEFDK